MTRRGKKRLFILLGLVGVVGVAGTTAYFVREARRAQELADAYRDGMAAYEAGDYQDALRGLGKSLSEHRNDPEVLYRVAESRSRVPLENNRHLTGAIAFAREASSKSPTDQRPLLLLIELYGRTGFVTERLEVANRLLELDADSRDAHLARVESLAAVGKHAEASVAADAFIASRPDDVRGNELKVELMRLLGLPTRDILDYVASVTANFPQSIELTTLQARVLAAFGQRDEAVAVAQRASLLEIPSTAVLLDLVRTLDLLGQRSRADELLDNAASDAKFRDGVFAYLIERAWKAGQRDRAREQVELQSGDLSGIPDNLLGWMALASLPNEGGWASTRPGTELASRTSEEARFWQSLIEGRELIELRRYGSARESVLTAVLIDDQESVAWSFLGEIAQRLREPDLAVSSLERAVQLDPTSSRAQMMLATSLLELGRLDEARAAAERAVVSNPAAPEVLTMARVYIALLDAGRSDSRIATTAVSIMEETATQAPDQPDIQALLARTYLAVGRHGDARAIIERLASAENLPAPSVLRDLAGACQRSAPELLEPLLTIVERVSHLELALLNLQSNQATAELSREAVRDKFETAIRGAVDSDERLQLELGWARYLDSGGDEAATTELRRLAEANPQSTEAQHAVLDSSAAWSDEALISASIERLKAITGEQGSRWKIAEGQRLLAFHAGEKSAAEVVRLLSFLTQPPTLNVRALVLSSDALLMLDDRPGAIQMLARALQREPSNPLFYLQTIELLQASGRSVEAAQRLREFVSLGDLPPALQRRRIELLSRQALWSDALRDAESLAVRTEDPADALRLALLYGSQSRTSDARRIYDRLLAQPDVSLEARAAAADFFAETDGFDRGLSTLQPLEATLGPSDYFGILASFHERHDRIDEAVQLLRNRAESSGRAGDWADLAELQVRQRRVEDARASVQTGLAAAPTDDSLLALRSLLDALQSGQLGTTSVQGILTALVDERLRPAMTRLAEAMQYLEANPDDLAGYIGLLRKAVDQDPLLILGWQLLTSALLSDGQSDEAVQAAHSAARILPASARAAELLATTLSDVGRLDEARLAAQRWSSLDPDTPSRAHLLLAQIEQAGGRSDRALTTIQPWAKRIVEQAGEFPSRVGLYASILIGSGRQQEAHELIWPRVQDDAAWAQMYAQLAAELPDPIDAIEWVDRAQQTIELTTVARAALAQLRISLGQRSGRIEQFRVALDLMEPIKDDPELSGQGLAVLAGCYQQIGDLARAEASFRRALSLAPSDPIIMNNLAYLLLRVQGKENESLQLASRAANLARERRYPSAVQANLLDTLGSAQLRLGLSAEAEASFRRGIALNSESAALQLGLVETLAKAGKLEQARSEYQQLAARFVIPPGDAELRARQERVQALLE